MSKLNFANRFGLAMSLVAMSLFSSTTAWAQKAPTGTAAAQGPQQVIVTNTAAQPVPHHRSRSRHRTGYGELGTGRTANPGSPPATPALPGYTVRKLCRL
jgi:hypothetical protein